MGGQHHAPNGGQGYPHLHEGGPGTDHGRRSDDPADASGFPLINAGIVPRNWLSLHSKLHFEMKHERIDLPETEEEKAWLEKQDFHNSAEDAYTG